MKLRKILIALALISLSLIFNRPVYAAGRVPVLMYHYIGNNPNPADKARDRLSVTPVNFAAQMDYLAQNGYTPLGLNDLSAGLSGQTALPAKPVVLTFDDGYVDFYANAFPILRSHGFRAVVFIPTGLMDRFPGFHLMWSQIQEMNSSGLVDFEAHGVNHVSLAGLNLGRLDHELAASKAMLEQETGRPVLFIAYPSGRVNGLVEAEAKKLGYAGGFGTWYGKTTGISMDMPRERISGSMSLTAFAARL